jgi:hypothetical protein
LNQEEYIKSVTVQYDPVLGYPQQIIVTCQSNVTDCGVTYESDPWSTSDRGVLDRRAAGYSARS